MKPTQETQETDVYRDILNLYVGNDPLRPALHTPFFQDEFVIATDAHAIICFGANRLKTIDFIPHENPPNALKLLEDIKNNCNIAFETIALRNAITKLHEKFEENYKIIDTNCPDCEGGGLVYYEFEDYRGGTHEFKHDCPTCEEKQVFTAIIDTNTGDEVEEFNLLIKVKQAHFNVKFFEKLVVTAEKLEAKSITLVHENGPLGDQKYLIHDTTVIIMPVRNTTSQDIIIPVI